MTQNSNSSIVLVEGDARLMYEHLRRKTLENFRLRILICGAKYFSLRLVGILYR